MKHTYTIILIPGQPDEGGYCVEVPALPGCFTEGQTVEQAICNAKEAVALYLQTLLEDGRPLPEETDNIISMIASVTVEV